jgi:threonine aldolase
VSIGIGAIQIETPVRRKTGEMFDYQEMQRISQWAREHGIGLHLDSARLFIASAYSGVPVREYGSLFDTVYISMYKYFNAASGAVLAGPEKLLANLFHTRRMFGGGLPNVWPFAAVANHYFDGFTERHRKAVSAPESVIATLQKDPRFKVTRVPNGTNAFLLPVNGVDARTYRSDSHRLESR